MFNTARIKLTLWYILILMSVSFAFSLVIYKGMSMEVDRFARLQRIRFERRFDELGIPAAPPMVDEEIINEMKQHIVIVLLEINGVILIVMGGLSYLLAGITLSPIQEMMEEQRRFVSDASHELRTPLTAMKSSLEVYVRDPKLTLNEAKKVLLDNIEEVNRLQTLSESLLTLSVSQTSHTQTYKTQDPTTILAKAITQVSHIAQIKHIKIKILSPPNIKILGNDEKLRELFTILLDNAIKYSPQKTNIIITGVIIGKSFEIRIRDEGIGIAEKDIPYVFDRFYRSDSARSRAETGGYGLGLSIAKKIAGDHNGRIKIESILNFGTTVIVTLPLS